MVTAHTLNLSGCGTGTGVGHGTKQVGHIINTRTHACGFGKEYTQHKKSLFGWRINRETSKKTVVSRNHAAAHTLTGALHANQLLCCVPRVYCLLCSFACACACACTPVCANVMQSNPNKQAGAWVVRSVGRACVCSRARVRAVTTQNIFN